MSELTINKKGRKGEREGRGREREREVKVPVEEGRRTQIPRKQNYRPL